jgi:S1-C subfamily serine protease
MCTLVKGANGFGLVVRGDCPVAITTVDSGSAAELAGLQEGDLIFESNGEDRLMSNKASMVSTLTTSGSSAINLLVKKFSPELIEEIRRRLRAGIPL